MKTISDLKKRKAEILEAAILLQKEKRELDLIRSGILYLEYKPIESFLIKQRAEINTIIKSKLSQFDQWKLVAKERDIKKQKASFKNELDIPKMREKLKVINYILAE